MKVAPAGFFTLLQTAATVLAGLSSIGYACGYLAMRARANALGTDPGFTLVDEAYVFAGFRFAIVLLVAAVITFPAVLAVLGVAGWLARIRPRIATILEPVALALVAIFVILQFNVLAVDNLLLRDSRDGWAEAALGRNGGGVELTLFSAALAILLGLWLQRRWTGDGAVTMALMILTLLQLILLPIIHGIFYADRKVRVFDSAPASAPALKGAVGVVFRGSGKVTLFGVNGDGKKRTVVVNEDELVGRSVSGIASLPDFLQALDARQSKPASAGVAAGDGQ